MQFLNLVRVRWIILLLYYSIGTVHYQCHLEVRLLFEAISVDQNFRQSDVQSICNRGLQQNLDIYFRVETKTKGGP